MSITYPEAPMPAAPKKAGGAAIMNSGSALFPTGATGVYERAAKARGAKGMPLAWIAAPVAVVLIGGGVYLAATHQNTAPPSPAVKTVTTQSVTPAAAPAPSLKVEPAAPAAVQTTRVTHAQTSVKTTGPAIRANPAPHVTRTATVSDTVSSPPVTTAPAAASTAAAPAVTAPAPAAPTPGPFASTPAAPAAGAVTTTPDTVTPAPAPAAPAPSPNAQPSPQA